MPYGDPEEALNRLPDWAKARARWVAMARENQLLPEDDPSWDIAFMQSGRGWGKTISGSQDMSEYARAHPLCRLALVGPTFGDVRDTMVEGPTGLLNVLPPSALRGGAIDTAWNRSHGELFFSNGSKAQAFSSERPDRLRGPQHDRAWVDEPASFRDAREGDTLGSTWNNLQLALRLGPRPRTLVTGTPKRVKLIKDILKTDRLLLIRGSTYENLLNLSPDYRRRIVERYRGTRVGRQELMGEFMDEVEGALWTQTQLDDLRHMDTFERISDWLVRAVVAIDPAVTTGEDADETGIVGAAVTGNDWCPKCGPITEPHAYVLADRSSQGLSPQSWAEAGIRLLNDIQGDRLVAEVNNGGDMVELTLRTVDPRIPYRKVTATRGKRVRAEPVAALYEQGRVHHLGDNFRATDEHHEGLEDQMVQWTPDSAESPDRMDALVWALTELMLAPPKRKVRILA